MVSRYLILPWHLIGQVCASLTAWSVLPLGDQEEAVLRLVFPARQITWKGGFDLLESVGVVGRDVNRRSARAHRC